MMIMGLVLVYAAPLFAKEYDPEKESTEDLPKATSASDLNSSTEDQVSDDQKKQTMAYLQDMGNSGMRVIVLGQLYTQETNILRQKQASFCDMYKLDVEKWRKGLYQFDEKTGKFIEKEAVVVKK